MISFPFEVQLDVVILVERFNVDIGGLFFGGCFIVILSMGLAVQVAVLLKDFHVFNLLFESLQFIFILRNDFLLILH
jgi:hypothetical protein